MCGFSESKILCLERSDEVFSFLSIYSLNGDFLNVIKFQRINHKSPFYLPSSLRLLELHNEKLIILYEKTLDIVDKSTGVLLKSFNKNSTHFNIDPKNDFILIQEINESKISKLMCYDLNGIVKSETSLKNKQSFLCYSPIAKTNEFTIFNCNSVEFCFN